MQLHSLEIASKSRFLPKAPLSQPWPVPCKEQAGEFCLVANSTGFDGSHPRLPTRTWFNNQAG